MAGLKSVFSDASGSPSWEPRRLRPNVYRRVIKTRN